MELFFAYESVLQLCWLAVRELRQEMTSFHDAEARRHGPRSSHRETRLPVGLSILVIGALSALSWAAVILLVLAIRSI